MNVEDRDLADLRTRAVDSALVAGERLAALLELARRELCEAPRSHLAEMLKIVTYGLNYQVRMLRRDLRGGRRTSIVYFMQQRVGAGDGPVKIGWSHDVGKRLEGLQTSTPHRIDLLTTIPGGQRLERELHERFATDRIGHGEWFRPSIVLMDFIASISTRSEAAE